MNKNKSKAAYTNKWLSRNRRFWHEEHVNGKPIIIIDKVDAPKIVLERVKEINLKRGWNGFDSTDEHIASFFRQPRKSKSQDKRLSIYTEEELKELEKEESSDDDVDYDEYDQYYEDDD